MSLGGSAQCLKPADYRRDKRSSSQSLNPDTIKWIWNSQLQKALYLLDPTLFPSSGSITAYPNPFTSTFTLDLINYPILLPFCRSSIRKAERYLRTQLL
jgi:hypothetical protein